MLERWIPNPRVRGIVVGALFIGLSLVYTQLILPGPKGVGATGTPLAILFQALLSGLLVGLVACGIVLVYRVQQFINFAASSIGAAGAFFGVYLIRLTPTPFVIAVPAGLLGGAVMGAAFELLFVRRFFNAARLTLTVMSIAATFALTGVVIGLVLSLPFFPRKSLVDPNVLNGRIAPRLPFPGFHFGVGTLRLSFGFGAVFGLWTAVFCLAGLGFFFRYTRAGTAVRAVADNPDRAELLGISTRMLSTTVWIIVGLLSAATVMASVFLDLGSGTSSTAQTSDALLLPLVAAVIARLRSFPVAMLSAVLISVVAGAAAYSYPGSDSAVAAAELLLLLVALFAQRRTLLRSEARAGGAWEASEEVRPIPAELAAVPTVRWTRRAMIAVAVAVALFFPFVFTTRISTLAESAMLLGIVALSLVVLTGWAGQVSLGQSGFMALGALIGGCLIAKVGLPFWFAVPLTIVATAGIAVVVGLPALRIKGLFLAAVTFAFVVAVDSFAFDPRYTKWLQPGPVSRPRLFFLDFNDGRSMYYLSLVALLLAAVVVLNLRRSRFGRVLIAMRDNEPALQAAGVSIVKTKLAAFAAAGALAGFAGIVYAVQQRGVAAADFSSGNSLLLFAYTVLGGITSVAGALLGQAASFVFQQNAINNRVFLLFEGFLPLVLLYFFPGGLVSVLESVRDGFLRIVAQRRQIVVPSLFADYDADALERRLIPLEPVDEGRPPIEPSYRRASNLYAGYGIASRPARLRQDDGGALGAAARGAADLERAAPDATDELEPAVSAEA